MSATTYKVAVVQAAPAFLDREAGLRKAITLIEDAAAAGASLIAFPETWIPGYPFHIWLGAPAYWLQFVQRYFENALSRDGAEERRLCEAARRNRIHVIMGHAERDGGSLYMAQWHIDDRGHMLARRRKLKPTHVERAVFGDGDGSDLVVSDTDLGRVGMLCCWEHLQPLTKYAMYAMHEQIHIAAWPSFNVYGGMVHAFGPEFNSAASKMYSAEGQCYTLAAYGIVSPEMLDILCDTPDKRAMLGEGGGYAQIYGPDGRPLADPLPHDQEGLIYADIDLGSIALAKSMADPVGHYSRPDVMRLLLDRNPAERVVTSPPDFGTAIPRPVQAVDAAAGHAIAEPALIGEGAGSD
ncbi:carbon-nitrogen hydrolase family protein [Zavarzinia compransoris]|uniref:carbon-nitrogen hydrolase family protein n=1 Tax=Zavarzinia marina TaxID=2911065 RepID=UPI001F29A242|nr:carbon-nitrogen hydrolase family protein [Zavarzinia marina]MCF4164589.1 carbon-nitrogen hydrolase family protein [Zavarzinia marina]